MGADLQALVSVRSVAEALIAANAGVRLIDCKEPRAGALGALPLHTVAAIVQALRARGCDMEISATIGDSPRDPEVEAARVLAAGVDAVKIGVASVAMLARLPRQPQRIVPVLIADHAIDDALLDAACEAFATVMLDTADKSAGSLLQRWPVQRLQRVIGRARDAARRVGVAGSLRASEVPLLRELRPDFAGFRSAVCDGGERGGALHPQRLRALLDALALHSA